MRFLQKFNEQNARPRATGDTPPSNTLEQAAAEAQRMLAAGDLAIRRALSNTDSESFLRANRQQGGE